MGQSLGWAISTKIGQCKDKPVVGCGGPYTNLSIPLGGGGGRRGCTIKSEATLVYIPISEPARAP